MGLFRSVHTELPCERCGQPFRVDVQFKTGADWQEVYEAGQELSAGECLELEERYEGIADRYCARCYLEWRCAEEAVQHEAMAEYVEGGLLVVTDPESKAKLVPEQLRERGREHAARLRDGSLSSHCRFGWHPLEIRWLGQVAERGNGPQFAFAEALRRRVDRKLKDAGWPSGWDWFREDLSVFVDDTRRIRVEVISPRRRRR